MQIVEGVYIHFIKTKKFKTNHLTCRFSGDVTKVNRARRALVAQMLATANDQYPNSRLLRQKLAELYGASLSTKLMTKGLVHLVDIDMSFVANHFALGEENILDEVMSLLHGLLFHPLRTVEQYQTGVFDLEQANLINYLEADKEDVFYYSDAQLDKLYFQEPVLGETPYGTADQVRQENSYTAFQEFRRMLKEDRIDLFLVGDIDEYRILQGIHRFHLTPRKVALTYHYQQPFSNVTQEKLEQKQGNQSILDLAYHVPISYGDSDYVPLLVVNGLLGLFPHSLLFTELREKEGLAYTISSHLNPYQGLLKIQAGIDPSNRQRTMQLITRQLSHLKSGRFTLDVIKKTKKMLINGAKLADDHQKSLVELTYNRAVLGEKVSTLTNFQAAVEAVTKKDLIRVASAIKLQAIYVMEGVDQ